MMELTAVQVRVLGSLMEKAATTPDAYPLSTNALVNACNQKTSREPVTSLSEREVSEAMLELRAEGLARTNHGGRADKHRHVVGEALGLDDGEIAVLAVMMLRGPQSPGELRTRTERAHPFGDLDAVGDVLDGLAERDVPLVRDLGRGPGQSQNRWAHLLGDDDPEALPAVAPTAAPAAAGTPDLVARVAALEERLAAIEEALGL